MSRKSGFKSRFGASGKNDVWFAVFFIGAVLVIGLLANARDTDAPSRPAPVPAAAAIEE